MKHPFSSYRKLFPILEHKVQLSSCSQSALSLPVRRAIDDYLEVWQTRAAPTGLTGWSRSSWRAPNSLA